jgi:hypothetical protein
MTGVFDHSIDSIAIAESLSRQSMEPRLTPEEAKLYSQSTRVRFKQSSLATWSQDEARSRYFDAIRLAEASFVLKGGARSTWRGPLRRAAEILEWLAIAGYSEPSANLRILSAAVYQLAGLPAMASCLLADADSATDHGHDAVIISFLRADFKQALSACRKLWPAVDVVSRTEELLLDWKDPDVASEQLNTIVSAEVVKAIAIVCGYMRWGESERLERALLKLESVARVFQNAGDSSAWLLAKLVSETTKTYAESAMRQHLSTLADSVSEDGLTAFDRYSRLCFLNGQALAWPSQVQGIAKLKEYSSFALCTPTGSGKTTIAEIALLQSMFIQSGEDEPLDSALALYLVPSRALAAQVEGRLTRVLARAGHGNVRITGLYGGADWSPADAWLTSYERTVLICTFEKAEALIRFLGHLFVHRINLVIVDEAHSVELATWASGVPDSDNRPLRMESMFARLMTMRSDGGCRAIALSAVTSTRPETLESWVSGVESEKVAPVSYHSTRQLLGRLECGGSGFRAVYDVLDGSSLEFVDERPGLKPYIEGLIPAVKIPAEWRSGAEVRLRPYLLWAALHLAARDASGRQNAVLISVPARIDGYAKDFCSLFAYWEGRLPAHFDKPATPADLELYQACADACADYYGEGSNEYTLLTRGVVVHRGSLPGTLNRLVIRAIERRVFNVVLATSTLTEGLNLPFDTILIPSLFRGQAILSTSEIKNLMGRAGRPGVATEGRTFVMLPISRDFSGSRARAAYDQVVSALIGDQPPLKMSPRSSLAELIVGILDAWLKAFPDKTVVEFEEWLERTTPGEMDDAQGSSLASATDCLDVLDAVLLPAIVEAEEFAGSTSPASIEEKLTEVWSRTYAQIVSSDRERDGRYFVTRGNALVNNIYPDPVARKAIYATGLSPRTAKAVIGIVERLRELLATGELYAAWPDERRLAFVVACIDIVSEVEQFKPKAAQSKLDWHNVIAWWLAPRIATVIPPDNKTSLWVDYAEKNFVYRFSWGFGSVLSRIIGVEEQVQSRATTLESWPDTGLPWIALWLRDLLVYGTLDPVVAFLMSSGAATSRPNAQRAAVEYGRDGNPSADPDFFDPRRIRAWHGSLVSDDPRVVESEVPGAIVARQFESGFAEAKPRRVVPISGSDATSWYDIAGISMAKSDFVDMTSDSWQSEDYWLSGETILSQKYLPIAPR